MDIAAKNNAEWNGGFVENFSYNSNGRSCYIAATNSKYRSFVFCCPIEWKSTLKIEDVTYGKVIFENGKPWTELER